MNRISIHLQNILLSLTSDLRDDRLWRILGKLEDTGIQNYSWLMAGTIHSYASLFRRLQRTGIDKLIEVGPGRTSLPAIANATLRSPLPFHFYEADSIACVALAKSCGRLGIAHTIENASYVSSSIGSTSECILFEHSLEDMYLSVQTPAEYVGNSPSDEALIRSNTQRRLHLFVTDLMMRTSLTRYGAVVFHHFSLPFSAPEHRDELDPLVVQSIEACSAFEINGQWATVPVAFIQRFAFETWRVFERISNGP